MTKRAKPTTAEIVTAFETAEEIHGEDKSTEFLMACTAEIAGVEYGDVVDALAGQAQKETAR